MTFSIDNTAYDSKVWRKKYSVNSKDLFNEWVDGNYITHRNVYRRVVTGSVVLTFTSSADLDAFADLMAESVTHVVELYVNNLQETKTINAYIETSGKMALNYQNTPGLWSLTLNIEER